MATKTTLTKKSLAPSRLSGAEREKHIAQEAVRFFAEVGFGGDTRELAKRLGVTQSLLYKYFPSKEALINRVYEEVYLGRWNPFWESVVRDRSIPLQERLTRHYVEYAKAALTRDWVRIFMFSGLRGEDSIAELCRKEGIAQSLYYTWSKEFMEAGKRRLAGDTARAATTGEVQDLRREARALKECVADLTLENRLLKKSMIADGGDDE